MTLNKREFDHGGPPIGGYSLAVNTAALHVQELVKSVAVEEAWAQSADCRLYLD